MKTHGLHLITCIYIIQREAQFPDLIGGGLVSVLASSAVDLGFEP
jgi:hypothetical protein